MATLKAVVDHRKADGTYCVKIRLTHNRKSLYITTSLYVTDRQLTRSKKIKDPNIITAAERTMSEIRAIIVDIEGVEFLECERLRAVIVERMSRGKVFRLDLYKYAEQKIEKMKCRTAMSYRTAFMHLRTMQKSLDVNDLTSKMMIRYRDYLSEQGVADNTIALYMSKIKRIFNNAKEEYNDDDVINIRVTPFKSGMIPKKQATAHRVITAEQIMRMSSICGDVYENFGRDVFLLSFCLIGINIVDLFYLKKSNVKGDYITYNRQKTKDKRDDRAEITIRIEKEAWAIINKYRDESKSDYFFHFHNRYVHHEVMTHKVNDFLRRLNLYDKTLPPRLCYYYARHSWATIAYNDCGVDMQTIHEALNHASDAKMRITDIYVKKDFSRIWEANRKVLDYVFGESNDEQ